jgi:mediator of RNA polymerase II transcription subunit 17
MSNSQSAGGITLRPHASSKKENVSVAERNAQLSQLVNGQGRHLRYITEESLQNEIETGKRDAEDGMEGVELEGQEEQKDAPTKEEQLRKLHMARMAMFSNVEYAMSQCHNLSESSH